jgi:hypothetical protein
LIDVELGDIIQFIIDAPEVESGLKFIDVVASAINSCRGDGIIFKIGQVDDKQFIKGGYIDGLIIIDTCH